MFKLYDADRLVGHHFRWAGQVDMKRALRTTEIVIRRAWLDNNLRWLAIGGAQISDLLFQIMVTFANPATES